VPLRKVGGTNTAIVKRLKTIVNIPFRTRNRFENENVTEQERQFEQLQSWDQFLRAVPFSSAKTLLNEQ
jgi:hypothetical protein